MFKGTFLGSSGRGAAGRSCCVRPYASLVLACSRTSLPTCFLASSGSYACDSHPLYPFAAASLASSARPLRGPPGTFCFLSASQNPASFPLLPAIVFYRLVRTSICGSCGSSDPPFLLPQAITRPC